MAVRVKNGNIVDLANNTWVNYNATLADGRFGNKRNRFRHRILN